MAYNKMGYDNGKRGRGSAKGFNTARYGDRGSAKGEKYQKPMGTIYKQREHPVGTPGPSAA